MILTRGTDLWVKLPFYFIDFERLILFLKQEEFTGTLQLIFSDHEGIIVFWDGDLVAGVQYYDGQQVAGTEAVDSLIKTARKAKSGVINVSRYTAEIVSILMEAFSRSGRTRYASQLMSDFTDIHSYIEKLKSDKSSGIMEIFYPKDRRKGADIILFKQGIIAGVLTTEVQFHGNDATPENLELLSTYLSRLQKEGIGFNFFIQAG